MGIPNPLTQGIFAGIKEAKATVDANYIRPGHYLFRIDNIVPRTNKNQQTIIVFEYTTIAVLGVDPGAKGKPLEVGETCADVMSPTKKMFFLPNLKGFIAAVLDMPEASIGVEDAEAICASPCPLAGIVIEVSARNQVTLKNTDFTKISYKRAVPCTELLKILPADTQALYFPGGQLEAMAEVEVAQAAAEAAAAGTPAA